MTAAHVAGLSRIPLALAAVFCLLELPPAGRAIAAGIVILAGFTDYLDGALARRQGTVSSFGAVLDFTTDKVFVLPVLVLAVRDHGPALWLAILIMVRELLVMGVRLQLAGKGQTVPSSRFGKLKSILLYPALVLLLLELPGGFILLATGALTALISGAEYLRASWPVLAKELSTVAPRGTDSTPAER